MTYRNMIPGCTINFKDRKEQEFLFAEDDCEIDNAIERMLPGGTDQVLFFKYEIKDNKFYLASASCIESNERAQEYMKNAGFKSMPSKIVFGDVDYLIDKKLDYNGKIVIGFRQLLDFCWMYQKSPSSISEWLDYEHPWWAYTGLTEYKIKNGNIIKETDHSDFIKEVRRKMVYKDRFEVTMAIDPRFSYFIKENGYDKKYWWLKKAIELKNKELHELYIYKKRDSSFSHYYAVIAKETNNVYEKIQKELNYLDTIDHSSIEIKDEDVKRQLNSVGKQNTMYCLLKNMRGKLNKKDVIEALKLIDDLYS